MCYSPWGLERLRMALSLQSDLIKCKMLQSHCLSLRMLHISSLCSQLFLLLQIMSKVNMTLSLWQRWIAPSMHFLISLSVIEKLWVLRVHTQLEVFPSLLCSQVGPCDYVLVNGPWAEVACVCTDATVTLLKDYLCTTFKSLIFSLINVFSSACTVIFLKTLSLLVMWMLLCSLLTFINSSGVCIFNFLLSSVIALFYSFCNFTILPFSSQLISFQYTLFWINQ